MYFLRSRNQELNTYINSFIEINYQPIKMFCWRILILCLLAIVRAGACRKSYIILGSLLIGLLSLINSQAIIWQLIFTENTQYIVTSIYVCLILTLVLSAVLESIALVARKRQLELIELSLFWIKSASTLKYIA